MSADSSTTPDDVDISGYSFDIKEDGRLSMLLNRDLTVGWMQAFFEALPSEFRETHEPEFPNQFDRRHRSLVLRNAYPLPDAGKAELIQALRAAAGQVNARVRAGEALEPVQASPVIGDDMNVGLEQLAYNRLLQESLDACPEPPAPDTESHHSPSM